MFPTFISILDIQSWWEVPCIAHFCSLFRTAFDLLDFDIEDLEEALLTDGTEEPSWLQELIVLLLKGCLPKNEISIFNYQMFLRRLFRKKCQEHHDLANPFNTDIDFQLLPLRAKVDILHALCDFRLEARDVLDKLRHLEAGSLRVEPLGHDANRSAYWYFYGTRLYREDKGESERAVWQVVCFTLNDWTRLARRLERSGDGHERALFGTLNDNFLPELPRLFREKESLARKRLFERLPRRTSNRLRIKEEDKTEKVDEDEVDEEDRKLSQEKERLRSERQSRFERHTERSLHDIQEKAGDSESEADLVDSREMVGAKSKDRKAKAKPQKEAAENVGSRSSTRNASNNAQDKAQNKQKSEVKPVGRQTNNSLASATGQILIQPQANPNRKKLKTSQVFSQTEEDLQTGLHKILDHVKNHEDAWPFIEPVEEEYAPNYYTIIRKPMDLQRMEERLDSGHYKTFSKFKTDFQLIVNNCRLYNGVDNEYSEMVETLLEVFNRAVERFLDQITSSDDEIAIEYPNLDKDKMSKKKKNESVITSQSRRKPTLAAQTDKKKERSPSPEQEIEEEEEERGEEEAESPYESEEEYLKPAKRAQRKEKERRSFKKDEDKEKENLRSNKKRKGRFEEVDVKPSKRQKLVPESAVKSRSNREVSEEREIVSKNKKQREPAEVLKKIEKKGKKVEEKTKKIEEKSKKSEEKSKKALEEKSKKVLEEKSKKVLEEKSKKALEEKSKKALEEKSKKALEEKSKKALDEKNKKALEEKSRKSEEKNRKLEEKSRKVEKKPQVEVKKSSQVAKKAGRKPKKASPSPERRSPSRDRWSSSPPPSWPPSSPENRLEFSPKRKNKSYYSDDEEKADNKGKQKDKNDKWKEIFKEETPPSPPKHKDKHNKLRETIEKLKAKSDIGYLKEKDPKPHGFEQDKLKENSDAVLTTTKLDKNKKEKEAIAKKKPKKDFEEDNSTMDSVLSKGSKKVVSGGGAGKNNNSGSKNSTIEALTLATEQTLKDINKWLDDTPKFTEFSPGGDSPSHFSTGIDEFDGWNAKNEQDKRKVDKPVAAVPPKKDVPTKEPARKRPFPKDQKQQIRRREVQRTIDRLQPGKSKGNLICNVPNAAKTDEHFPLGPLSKIKDTKNSLIVKTDESAPKLSLGSVLDSFGEHKFVDDEPTAVVKKEEVTEKSSTAEEVGAKDEGEAKKKEEVKKEEAVADPLNLDNSLGKATPNLSAWFKAFGAPKVQPVVKKADVNKEDKPESETKKEELIKKVQLPDPSPNPDSPVMQGQPAPRQRKLSTGSSMSERSSFSQDMDSPRVGIDERIGAYPAPYPSPLHKSPSSPNVRSPLPDASPKSTPYPFNGQIRVGFYQDTVSTKSSPDKSCSPRDNPQSPHAQFSEHVYTPQTMQSPSYGSNNAYYTHPPNYSSSNPTPPYTLEHSPNPPSYYDTSKPLTDQYKDSVSSPVGVGQGSPAEAQALVQQPQAGVEAQQQQQQAPASLDLFNQESDEGFNGQGQQGSAVAVETQFQQQSQQQQQQQMQQLSPALDKYRSTQDDFNKLTSNVEVYNQHATSAPTPTDNIESYRSQQVSIELLRQQQQQQLQQLQQQQQQMQQQLQQQLEQVQPSTNVDAYRSEQPVREKLQQPSTVAFPVKKRAYSDIEQSARYDEQQYNRSNVDMSSLMSNRLPNEQLSTREPPKYVHQNIPEPPRSLATNQNHQQTTAQQPSQETNNPLSLRNSPFAATTTNHPFSYNDSFPINIPSTARSLPEPERKVDMSKYVNVGYTGNDMAFSRNPPQQYNKPEINYLKLSSGAEQQGNVQQHMNIGGYKIPTQTSVADSGAGLNSVSASRLAGFKQEVSVPKPTYSSEMEQSLALRGNLANLTHIVDRYQNEDRILSGLQTSAGSYYADKNLPTQHMFGKPISTANSMSGLPAFSQPNSMTYGHSMQSAGGVYSRASMGELQNAQMLAQERTVPTATLQQQIQEKKTKKRKTSKAATPPTSAIEQPAGNVPTQGFQSYSGLKNPPMEPSAISLKTASVVPGSAFNFGPTAPGLGLGSGMYTDKDSYPNFCSAPNYYMAAAAAAHHRSTPESGEKPTTKSAHQSNNQQQQQQQPGYPFIPGPQSRPPNYPLGGPFMAPHHQGLMDPNSPLYQQYLQAGLHQGLLGPPGAYPPGYHPALSMRQPYDSMTRPSWL